MKQSKKITISMLLMAFVAFLSSCNNDNDEPSLSRVQLEMKAATSLSTISTSGRMMGTGLIFDEVLIGVTELEFETLEENEAEQEADDLDGEEGDGEDENDEVEYEGNFTVDLLSGTVTPDFGIADVAPGLYEEIEVEMGPVLEGGNSIFIAFRYPTGNGDTLNVEFSSTEEFELEIENENGFLLDGGSVHQMIVQFDLDAFFNSMDLSQAVADGDGVIRLNGSSNSGIADLIESSIDNAFDAGEDKDGDDEIDND
ncbi:DUF4382 domain-containing protein [Fulvivirga sp. 29W222]|uniref:DUF4382 domain-containing protein n=1 Tax=Fulvivirga marina TaxID=2494733 RepID=A0A937KF02_9BACT|nr:DUF4382 domain-containing protein [Fulvivirga marina]MBL6447693.1 DUF4382 domain-containing protein [Fulvivirga marina]